MYNQREYTGTNSEFRGQTLGDLLDKAAKQGGNLAATGQYNPAGTELVAVAVVATGKAAATLLKWVQDS